MFWKETFLKERREEWLKSLSRVVCTVNGVDRNADIQQKKIVGDTIEIFAVIPHTDSGIDRITKVKIFDHKNQLAGERIENITKNYNQGALFKLEFPIREV